MKKAAKKKLDVTRPGGYYLGADGKPHDAEGRLVKAGAAAPKPAAGTARVPEADVDPASAKGALPEQFPSRRALVDAGVDTWEALRSIEEVLTEIDGLDAATIDAIKAELGGS